MKIYDRNIGSDLSWWPDISVLNFVVETPALALLWASVDQRGVNPLLQLSQDA